MGRCRAQPETCASPSLGVGAAPETESHVSRAAGTSSCRLGRVFIELFSFSFFSITGWIIGLDYCDIEWFALETKKDHSAVLEIALQYCILNSY